VTVAAADIVTVQGPVPVQPPPLQPAKTELALGVAASATTVPLAKLAVQAAPQLMSPGMPVTVPVPSPLRPTVSEKIGVKVAVTVVAAETVTVQGPVPVQPPPLQPMKTELVPGVAVSATAVPLAKLAVQLAPQLISPGMLVTVPLPLGLTASVKVGAKVAVTVVAAETVTVQRPVPVQPPPLQPMKTELALGVAVSTTTVPLAKLAVQLAPQLTSPGMLVTVPFPLGLTVSVKVGVKIAVTVVAADIVTVQGPVPVQPPPFQPRKTELAPGVAVSTTTVPLAKLAVQLAPQLMSPGVLVTVPVPSPLGLTVSAKVGRNVTARLATAVLPAASRAVTVSMLVPTWSAIPLAVQLVVPLAVPLPRPFVHVTSVTPTLSDAVPSSVRSGAVVL